MHDQQTETYHFALNTQREISETLNQSTDIYETLQSSLEKLLKMMNLTTGWIFLVYDENQYELAAHHQLPPALDEHEQTVMRMDQGCSDCYCLNRYNEDRLTEAVQSIRCARLTDAKKMNPNADTSGLTHHASVPLTVRGAKVGLLNLATPGMREFRNDELLLLESVAYQIGATVERIRLYNKQSEMLITQERTRLARDLHDSVKQKLFALSLTAKGVESLSKDVPTIQEAASDINTLSQEALFEMQSLIWQLRPEHEEDSVCEALEKQALRLGLKPHVQCACISINEPVQQTFIKIGQEAIFNTYKHSESNTVKIELKTHDEIVVLTIEDEGVGGALTIPGRFGMKSMQERAVQIGATLSVDSPTNKGTKVEVQLHKEVACIENDCFTRG
ncbi:GAF domain-containing sensor histidine kinase [Geomicrobium sp. JCM 19055]|uniref:GAF domain-containing sensor histidine kinase n=1 Tax=Geomicrobium sp. JCM 19055 TaxID=1460649 RepID=UPI00045ED205|nr:GAF domain-containing sensor histidine kinase [Geomicrobium sp. JCM 19055]GAK00781.1 two-component sensor histidine kinase [Geomicrobium sp. JCM 19055]